MDATPLQRAQAALAAHAPDLAGLPLADLGGGLDHAVFRVGDLAVRVAREGRPADEAELLGTVARHVSLSVPRPVLVDDVRGVLIHQWLPGRPLLGRTAPPGVAAVLGRFLHELHAVDPAEVVGLVPTQQELPAVWLDDLEGPTHLLEVLHASVPPPTDHRVLAHADLGAEHVLEDGGRISGVIDWSDAALADPALDLARLLRDFGPAFLEDVIAAYGPLDDDVRRRITFHARCAALEDLAYGHSSGREAYTRNAERSLGWLFPFRDPDSRPAGE